MHHGVPIIIGLSNSTTLGKITHHAIVPLSVTAGTWNEWADKAPHVLGNGAGRGMQQRFDAIIIGGGHNGLVTAAYLARAGLQTLVLEPRSGLGGGVAPQ